MRHAASKRDVKPGFGLILLAAAVTAGCATSTMTAAVVTGTGAGVSARPASPPAPAPSPAAGQSTRQPAEAARRCVKRENGRRTIMHPRLIAG